LIIRSPARGSLIRAARINAARRTSPVRTAARVTPELVRWISRDLIAIAPRRDRDGAPGVPLVALRSVAPATGDRASPRDRAHMPLVRSLASCHRSFSPMDHPMICRPGRRRWVVSGDRGDRARRRPGFWASSPVRDPVARRSPAAWTAAAMGFASCRVVDTDTGASRARAHAIGSRPPLPAPIRSWVYVRCRRGERPQSVQPFDRRPVPVSGLHRSPFSVLMKPMPCRSDVGSYWSRRSDRLPV
jgi:hypothetical protein